MRSAPVGFVGGILVGIAFVACGSTTKLSERIDMAVTALGDLAGVHFDGGDSDAAGFFDLANADAQSGGTMVTLDCDKMLTITSGSAGFTNQTVYYFAEVETGKQPNVAAPPTIMLCEREEFSPSAYCTPSAGVSCAGYIPPKTTCEVLTGGSYADTKLVVNCGYHLTLTTVSGDMMTTSSTGSRWKKAYVLLP